MTYQSDILVVGSGIAGLFFTLKAADKFKIILVTKKDTVESNTNYAQGGIASVFHPEDDYSFHIEDTLKSGWNLSHRDAVEAMVRQGPELVQELMDFGVKFTTKDDHLDLGREGGHTRHRIVHARDLTGQEIEHALVNYVRKHPNVTVLENHIAIDLITEHNLRDNTKPPNGTGAVHCWGAYVLEKTSNTVHRFLASTTMLATGGAGQVYAHTTNPAIATGGGIAMAYRAGASIANMEFIQFHPTTLYHPMARSFLITEAIRGAGAYLLNSRGERFMGNYDERKELAPRDIVARAMDSELKRLGDESVFLDTRHLSKDLLTEEFPTVYNKCLDIGIDITSDMIPVVPSAHYSCGGVLSDLEGRSTIQNLLVSGEVAMTGVHGANRLASNSLLEALVFAYRASQSVLQGGFTPPPTENLLDWDESDTYNADEWVLISHNSREVKSTMWDYVGIVRSDFRLNRAKRRIDLLRDEIEDFYKRTKVSEELIELRNITQVADIIIQCAIKRKESRGLHFTTDYPEMKSEYDYSDTILSQ
jgi:L-aspartate oxidase